MSTPTTEATSSAASTPTAPAPAPVVEPGPGQFLLDIEISGICLHVRDVSGTRSTLVMPDARRAGRRHADGQLATPHVGYLRFDLRNASSTFAGIAYSDDAGGPQFEVVHRFAGEEMSLGVNLEGEQIGGSLDIPDFNVFAPVLEPKPGVLAEQAPDNVLMRMVLTGGAFETPVKDKVDYRIPADLRPDGLSPRDRFGGEVHWRRVVTGDGLTVRLTRFDGKGSLEIPLRPAPSRSGAPVINLKVANLCSNPLEWDEIETPPSLGPDNDFKWLYTLMQRKPDASAETYPDYFCPVPTPILKPLGDQGDIQDCFSAKLTLR